LLRLFSSEGDGWSRDTFVVTSTTDGALASSGALADGYVSYFQNPFDSFSRANDNVHAATIGTPEITGSVLRMVASISQSGQTTPRSRLLLRISLPATRRHAMTRFVSSTERSTDSRPLTRHTRNRRRVFQLQSHPYCQPRRRPSYRRRLRRSYLLCLRLLRRRSCRSRARQRSRHSIPQRSVHHPHQHTHLAPP
jgi:hypothetical protein